MAELSPNQKKVLEFFAKSSLKDRFYWTGETLLSSFYLHHRRSQDIDFFSDEPFSYNQIIGFVRDLKKQLELSKIEEKKIFDRWEFFLHNQDELRIEFVAFEHPQIKPRKRWKGIRIDSLEDIAANKAMALFDRREPKDLVDLYFLLKKYKIKVILGWVEKKFGITLAVGSFWSECCRTLDNLDQMPPFLLARDNEERQRIVSRIKEYFSSQSSEYLKKALG